MKRLILAVLFLASTATCFADDKLPLVITSGFSRQLSTADDLLIHDRLTSTAVLILEPGGTGALQGDLDGNSRGANATDWQRLRASAGQVAFGAASVLAGGENNTVSGEHCAIGGGLTNSIESTVTTSSILGGTLNQITNNSVSGVIGGGSANTIVSASDFGFIGSGQNITISATDHGVIGGGDTNSILVTSTGSTIGGGLDNEINDCLQAVIGGGELNTITNSSDSATIGGGQQNDVTTSLYALVGGGINNTITGSPRSTICGGENHDINTAQHATICGGRNNDLTSADFAFMAGGENNTTSSGADYSFCSGRSNEVSAIYSAAFGLESSATQRGEFAHSSGHFAIAGDAQTSVFVVREDTTDATVTNLSLNGAGDAMDLPQNSLWTFSAIVSGLQDTGANGAGYKLEGVLRRDGAATAVLVGTVTQTVLGEDVASWNATAVASGNTLRIQVTGAALTNINWVARVEVAQVIVAN